MSRRDFSEGRHALCQDAKKYWLLGNHSKASVRGKYRALNCCQDLLLLARSVGWQLCCEEPRPVHIRPGEGAFGKGEFPRRFVVHIVCYHMSTLLIGQ